MCRLGHSIGLDNRNLEELFQFPHDPNRQARRRGSDESERVTFKVTTKRVRSREYGLVNSRHRCVPGWVKCVEPRKKPFLVEARSTDYAGTDRQRGKQRPDNPMNMKQRHYV